MAKRCLAFTLCAAVCMGCFSYAQQDGVNTQSASAVSEEAQANQNSIDDTQKKLDELMEQQKQLDSQINSTQGNIEKEEEKQKAINSQIETVQKTILALESSITELSKQIDSLGEDISKQEQKIIEKKEEIDKGTEEFNKRLRALYIVGDNSYTSVIAGSTDFYDMLMKIELVKRVANHDNNMIDKLISMKAQFEADKKELESKKATLEENKSKLESQQKDHESQRAKLQDLLKQSKQVVDDLERQKKAYEANKQSIDKDQDKFEKDLAKLFEERKAIADKEAAEEAARKAAAAAAERQRQQQLWQQQQWQQQQSSSSSSSSSSSTPVNIPLTGSGFFKWPVPGYYGVTSEFGPRWGTNHNGIDICSYGINGADICAAAPGKVIRVENYCTHNYGKNGSCGCGGGYGRYCIIDHGNGLWSLYGHQTNVLVSVGQKVKTGDVIGKVGSTGYSTGAHLHFEVRKNGYAVNPRNYM